MMILLKSKTLKKISGIMFANELLENKNKPEAIFVANLELTLGAILSIKSLGLKIPDDIAVIGFDDSDWAQILNPH